MEEEQNILLKLAIYDHFYHFLNDVFHYLNQMISAYMIIFYDFINIFCFLN